MLEVATALRDKADGRLKGDCDYFIKWAERCIQKESARPLVALAANAMAVVGGCNVLGGHGLPPQVGQSWNLIFSQGRLHLVRGLVIADVPYAEIVALEIGGPAAERRGGGFFAGGSGVTGAAEGMLVAAALNLLAPTASTTVSTVVCLMTSSAELFLHTSSETPDDLRMRLSPVFSVLRRAGDGAGDEPEQWRRKSRRAPGEAGQPSGEGSDFARRVRPAESRSAEELLSRRHGRSGARRRAVAGGGRTRARHAGGRNITLVTQAAATSPSSPPEPRTGVRLLELQRHRPLTAVCRASAPSCG